MFNLVWSPIYYINLHIQSINILNTDQKHHKKLIQATE